ncbi:hypothetical protein TanjilG_05835 [Lupinus angustifolius]|uniref:Uncharacterized protein n=1 Tax=Lupinus angustifolius TaxID=3871 RepID=A0A4P1R471_LUPAN|nr:hypothetical protein TanjilG_05835 [Lupinus angustifolius]
MYNAPGSFGADFGSTSATLPPPVYNKSVYDDGIFDGVTGLKTSSKVQYDDVFASDGGRGGGGGGSGGGVFDDLIGGFSKEPKSSGATRPEKDDKGVSDFDDLLVGFGTSSRPSSSDRLTLNVQLAVGICITRNIEKLSKHITYKHPCAIKLPLCAGSREGLDPLFNSIVGSLIFLLQVDSMVQPVSCDLLVILPKDI